MSKLGVYIGRFSPMHLGHQAVIDGMVGELGIENCLVFVGSANTPQSMRHLFSYMQRAHLIKMAYPEMRVMPLPDFGDNDQWMYAMTDMLAVAGATLSDCVFYAGCNEDVLILSQYTQNIAIVNRFDGTTPKISATEVRDALINDRSLVNLLSPTLSSRIQTMFQETWEEFKRK